MGRDIRHPTPDGPKTSDIRHPAAIPNPQFPIPNSQFSILNSQFSIPNSRSVPDALKEALKLFIVRRDDVKTVIAGYPWFLDWGRDTFIFLRGAIPAGFM